MKAIKGKGKKSPNRLQRQRNGLLAKVHVAKKELALLEDDYRAILQEEFGVTTAAALTVGELQSLVRRFESKGWVAQSAKRKANDDGQSEALKERVGQELLRSDFTPARFRGLVRKICGVDDLAFCNDTGKLKRLLAAMGKINAQYN